MFRKGKQLLSQYYCEQSHFTHREKLFSSNKKQNKQNSLYIMDSVPNVTFSDIAGHEEVKKDLQFIIDFLKNPERYKKMGARMPKGIILYGPPGTGKTLHAKAIAGTSGVPFLTVSGSDFMERYVGVGAKMVRELFKEAREAAPCIIFIDEMDAVGGKRNESSNTEKDHTINALLTELDGFKSSCDKEIVVIGATNRIDMLDPALTRAGRFDRHIAIPLPDCRDRLEIINVHSKNKPISSTVDIENLAKITIGFSGADIENLLNESAIIAASSEKNEIDIEDIENAFFKITLKGNKKKIDHRDNFELEIVAWHEAGHALVNKIITKQSIPKVTITPSTSGFGGATFIIPEKTGLLTKRDLINEVMTSYGGRIGEFLLTKNEDLITTGASRDIQQATSNIIKIIKEFGMTEKFGMLYMEGMRGFNQSEIVKEASYISKSIYDDTLKLLKENYSVLEKIAKALIEKETIYESELDFIINSQIKRTA